MARYTFVLLLALFLAACGGADDQDLTQRYALQARAQAWENRMPMAITPGQELGCTGLMVSFSIRSNTSTLPPGVLAQAVPLSKPGLPPLEIKVSQSESRLATRLVSAAEWLSLGGSVDSNFPPGGKSEQIFSGIARTCATENFRLDDELLVRVHIASNGEAAIVETKTKLYAAY